MPSSSAPPRPRSWLIMCGGINTGSNGLANLLRSYAGSDGHRDVDTVPIVISAHFPNFQARRYK